MDKRICVSNGNVSRMVDLNDILYFETSAGKIILHFEYKGKEEVFEFAGTFSGIGPLVVKEGFVRIHRCYIVNQRKIISVDKAWVTLEAARRIRLPLGRTFAGSFREQVEKSERLIWLG